MGNATPATMLADAEKKIESLMSTVGELRAAAARGIEFKNDELEAQVKEHKNKHKRAREVRNRWAKQCESQRDLIELLEYRNDAIRNQLQATHEALLPFALYGSCLDGHEDGEIIHATRDGNDTALITAISFFGALELCDKHGVFEWRRKT